MHLLYPNAEIVNFLISTGEIDEFYQAQEEIRNCQYETTATYAREAFGFDSISSMEVNTLTEKYNLQLPLESGNGFIDNGTINVQRNLLGDIVDIWYIFGVVSPSAFSVKVAMVDSDNPLDSITGTITRYYLGTTRWVRKDSESFSKTAVTNGTVYTWHVAKWGVKEKFEYNIKIVDNGITHNKDNKDENNYTRYNFEAKPYESFSANDLTAQEGFHVDDFGILERQIAAIADLQLGKLRRSLHQLRRTVRRNLLIPSIPISLAAAGLQLQNNMPVRLKFRIMAELTANVVIRLAFAEDGPLHVGFHFFKAFAEPAFRIAKAPDFAVVQNTVQLVQLRQMIDLGGNWGFYICHTHLQLHFKDGIPLHEMPRELAQAEISCAKVRQ